MERRIRSFETLTEELRDKLQEQYPDGIENHHIRTVSTPKGENLRVIELRTADVLYLIKLTPESRQEMDEFLEQDSDDVGGDDIGGSDDIEGADEEEEEEETDAPPADDEDDDDED
ncbi:MAG TPA: hypothetical protein PKD45_12455 [Flavobacteriales bacterium]|nr:hypothetical protein [Flavobacteriales bacterium]